MKKYTSDALAARMNARPVSGPVKVYAPGDVIPGMGKVVAVGRKTPTPPAGWDSVETFAPDQKAPVLA